MQIQIQSKNKHTIGFSPDSRRPISLPNQRLLKNRSITALTTMSKNTEKLWNQIVELKCTSKLLQRQSRRCIKDKKSNKLQIKKAIEKGNIDLARIHAETAIRNHNSQLTYLRLSSRLDGLVSRLQTQATINTITKSISTIVKTLEYTLTTENLQKMSETMDQFERQFVDMEVKGEVMESSWAGSMAGSVAEGDVDSMMQQVVEDYGLAVSVGLPKAGVHAITAELKEKVEEDDLRTRLADLKQHG